MTDASPSSGPGEERQFKSKVALVVGASKGIGADTARLFARRGASVVLASRDVEGLTTVAQEIQELGQEALVVPLDLTDDASIDRLGTEIRTRFGRLDVAFNNSGEGAPPTDLADVPPATFDLVFRVTVRGTFRAMQQEIPLLLATGGGAIVNMSSTAGISAFRGGGPVHGRQTCGDRP